MWKFEHKEDTLQRFGNRNMCWRWIQVVILFAICLITYGLQSMMSNPILICAGMCLLLLGDMILGLFHGHFLLQTTEFYTSRRVRSKSIKTIERFTACSTAYCTLFTFMSGWILSIYIIETKSKSILVSCIIIGTAIVDFLFLTANIILYYALLNLHKRRTLGEEEAAESYMLTQPCP